MLANSGLEAKAVRLSTASIRGPVAALHFSLFSWLKAPSKACTGDMAFQHQKKNMLDCRVSTVYSCDNVSLIILILSLIGGKSISPTFLDIVPHESLTYGSGAP